MRALLPLSLLSFGACASGGALPSSGPVSTTTTIVAAATPSPTSMAADVTMKRDESGVVTAIAAPPEQAWNALVATYASLGVPPGTVNVQQRVYGNEALEPKDGKVAGMRTSLVLSCGTSPTGVPLAQSYRVRVSVVSMIAPAEGGSRLTTRVMGTAASREIAGSTPVTCGSSGKLEERIATLVADQTRR